MNTANHDQDFYAWTQEQAALLRAGRLSELDTEHLIEELESMGASERRELINRLAVLLAHLLKWRYQPKRRSNSWRYTIVEQRLSVDEVLNDNPSLKHRLEDFFIEAYMRGRVKAAKETNQSISAFPESCPFTLEETLDRDFFPDL